MNKLDILAVVVAVVVVAVIVLIWKGLNLVWFRLKKYEVYLKRWGFFGILFIFFVGDVLREVSMVE